MTKSANSKIRAFVAATLVLVMALTALVGCVKTPAISLDVTEQTMYIADTLRLTATAPEDAEITWTTSNDKVATVRRGTVVAVGVGEATITASLDSGDSATCKVTVLDRTVTISRETAVIDLDSGNLSVTLTATSSDGGAITWSSSDASLATVSNGVVTAVGGNNIGKVIITAQRGAATATCVVDIVKPSLPDDFKLLESKTNSDTIGVRGNWTYFGEGPAANFTYTENPWYGGNAVGVTFNTAVQPDGENTRFYFRYQPTFGAEDPADEIGTEYVMSFTVEISADVEVKYGQPVRDNEGNAQYNTFKSVKVTANTAKQIVYFGTLYDVAPFSICIEKSEGVLDGVKIRLTNISVRERTPEDVEPEPEKPDPENPGNEYDLVWGDKSTTISHPNRWYYMVNSGSDGHGTSELASTPTYKNGVVTLALSSTTAGQAYQVRYQPDMDYGTLYTVTFTVNLSAQANILVGIDTDNETFTDIEVGQDVTLTYNGTVSYQDPFHIEIRNFEPGAAITLVVKDVTFVERQPDPDEGEKLTWGSKSEVSSHKGTWYYMINSDNDGAAELVSKPTNKDGVITLDLKNTASLASGQTYAAAYQLRYQPNLADGTDYKITFKVRLTAQAYLIVGNDAVQITYPEGATTGADVYCEVDTEYEVEYTGTVTNGDPFYIQIKAADTSAAIKLTVYDVEVEEVVGGGEDEPGNGYDLQDRTNGETIQHPGEWAYKVDGTAGTDYNFVSTPRYNSDKGTITFALRNVLDNNATYQLRYQPDFGTGAKYSVTFTITVSGACKVIYGKEYYSYDFSGAGTHTITHQSEVDASTPFLIGLKGFDGEISITVSAITFTKTEDGGEGPGGGEDEQDNGYDLQDRTNGETIQHPGEWAYKVDGTAGVDYQLESAPRYNSDKGTITFALKNVLNNNATYQLRYQPDFGTGAKYSVTFTITVSGACKVIYGKEYSSYDFSAAGTHTITHQSEVDASTPFLIGLKGFDGEISITVSAITFTNAEDKGEDDGYELEKAYNSTILANAGKWYYKADGEEGINYELASKPTYADETITFAFTSADDPTTKNYQLAYQPEFEVGTTYTIKFTVTVSAACKINLGTNYQTHDFSEGGTYELSWTGAVDANTPFYIGLKNFTGAITLTVSNITIQQA